MQTRQITDEQMKREKLIILIWLLRRHWPPDFLEKLAHGQVPRRPDKEKK